MWHKVLLKQMMSIPSLWRGLPIYLDNVTFEWEASYFRVEIKKDKLDLVMHYDVYWNGRVSSYEELESYVLFLNDISFIEFVSNAEEYSEKAPLPSKGKDEMSPRSIRKW